MKAREDKRTRQALEQAQRTAVTESELNRKRLDDLRSHADKQGYLSDPAVLDMLDRAEVRLGFGCAAVIG